MEQLGFAFEVNDKATGPLGKIEKAYMSLVKTLDIVGSKLAKAMKSHSDRTKEAGEAAEKTERKKTSLWKTLKEKLSPVADKVGTAFGDVSNELKGAADAAFGANDAFGTLWKIMGMAGLLGVVIGFIGFLGKALSYTKEFQREAAKLNEAFAGSAKDSREMASAYFSLSHSFGKTEGEASGLVRALAELGQTPVAARAAGTSFKELAKVTMAFSAATGASSEASAKLTDQLLRINQVSPNNLRGVGYAIKYIADNSHITTDELLALNEAMEPLMASLTGKSSDFKAEYTKNFLAVGGALSEVGIDGKKAMGDFADMLDETSAEGIQKLAQLSHFTGLQGDALKDMIKTNPAGIFDALAKKSEFMRRTDPIGFKLAAQSLKPLNLGFAELTRLAERYGVEGKESFSETAERLANLKAKDEALLETARRRQGALDGMMSRFKAQWDALLLRVGSKLIDKIVIPIMKRVMPAFEKMINYLAEVDWDGLFDGAIKVFDVLSSVAKATLGAISAGFEFIALTVGGVIHVIKETWNRGFAGLFDSGKVLFSALIGWSDKWSDKLLSMWDDILINAAGLANILAKIPGIGDDMAEGFKGLVEGAEKRTKEREEAAKNPRKKQEENFPTPDIFKKTGTMSEDARGAAWVAQQGGREYKVITDANGDKRTEDGTRVYGSNPRVEQLTSETNQLLKQVIQALHGGATSKTGALKNQLVNSLAGGQ